MSPTSGKNNPAVKGPDLLADIPDALPSPALAQMTRDILDDVIYNIIYDIVGKVHREEKLARANTAAVLARNLAEKELAAREAAAGENGDHDKAAGTTTTETKSTDKIEKKVIDEKRQSSITIETDVAIYEDGQVYLRGNPLETVHEIICSDCHLPRLLYPLFGEGSRPVPDPNKQYCRKRPPIRLPARDIHGRPYAIEKATKKKKTAVAASPSPPSSPSTPHNAGATSLEQLPGKTYVPSVKCPNCPRYFFLTRIAQHLDRCVGISTRTSRNRTPLESGLSTPVSSHAGAPATAAAAGVGSGIGVGARKRNGEDDVAGSGVAPIAAKKKKKPLGPSKLRNMADDNPTKKEKE